MIAFLRLWISVLIIEPTVQGSGENADAYHGWYRRLSNTIGLGPRYHPPLKRLLQLPLDNIYSPHLITVNQTPLPLDLLPLRWSFPSCTSIVSMFDMERVWPIGLVSGLLLEINRAINRQTGQWQPVWGRGKHDANWTEIDDKSTRCSNISFF